MCGILGKTTKRTEGIRQFKSAFQMLASRGPDQSNIVTIRSQEHTKNEVYTTLGHSRLIIEGDKDNGVQPMTSKCRTYTLIYNGEIYNFREILSLLQNREHLTANSSDTEVLLQFLCEFGIDEIHRLNGMWAFAFLNNVSGELLICRDRFGVKPLYYTLDVEQNSLFFSSTIKSLLHAAQVSPIANIPICKEFLQNGKIRHTNETFYQKVFELEPGHFLKKTLSGVTITKYYDLETKILENRCTTNDIKFLIEDAVRVRAESASKFCVALSGGLDSNIINSIAAKKFKNIPSFSIIFKNRQYSEESYITDSNSLYSNEPDLLYPTQKDYIDKIDEVLTANEEPFRSLSLISLHILYSRIKKRGTQRIVLTGQGADEVFGGYSSHMIFAFWNSVSSFRLKTAHHLIKSMGIKKIIFDTLKIIQVERAFPISLNQHLLSNVVSSPLREYLSYEDRISMFHGLEVRSPFMDYRVIEAGLKLDPCHKINQAGRKDILVKAFRNVIPSSVTARKDKMGFVSPQKEWQNEKAFRDKLIQELEHFTDYQLLTKNQRKVLASYLQKEKTGNWPLIWRIFIYTRWKRNLCKSSY